MLAYFDCFSGISGDMTLGALNDLGVPLPWLKEKLIQMPLTGFNITVETVTRNGISAKLINVVVDKDQNSRDYNQIRSLIQNSPYSDFVKKTSLDIFERIAEAESQIHDCHKEKVHFHEVGGIDAIVDIVGTALGIEYLNIDRIIASKIPLGNGFVDSMHGVIPVPSPATLLILKGVPVYGSGIPQELVTPTGAAIITALAESFDKMPEMKIEKVGYGSGQRILETQSNLLRVISGEAFQSQINLNSNFLKDEIVIVETSIDDMNPEWFGFLMDRLFENGALDVYWIPIYMKKNRPGTLVQVLCRKEQKETMVKIILSESTSLGVRIYFAHRFMLKREVVSAVTSYGQVQIKQIWGIDGKTRFVPEYDCCRKISIEHNIPIRVVYDTIINEMNE